MLNLDNTFWAWQEAYDPSCYVVALSGGLDSVALLHMLVQMKDRLSATLEVSHINHGWAAEADEWVEFCRNLCAQWGVPFSASYLDLSINSEEGREGQARRARYEVWADKLPEHGVLLTAHHEDDQAETLLLQLLRGSGLAGLAAMPERKLFAQGEHWRPLLSVSRSTLSEYATNNNLCWVDDPSNSDTRYARNYLRHKVIPVINEGFPSAISQIARSASWLAESKSLLDESADDYLDSDPFKGLNWGKLEALQVEWQRTIVRRWLQRQGLRAPGYLRLDELLRQISEGSGYAELTYDDVVLFYYRDTLSVISCVLPDNPPQFNKETDWAGLGRLTVELQEGMEGCHWRWSLYPPGKHFQPLGKKHSKPLKDWFQKAAIPPLIRRWTPLLWCDDELAWVGGLGVADKFNGLVIDWQKSPFSANISPNLQASD